MKNIETVNGVKLYFNDCEVRTETLICADAKEIQDYVDIVLKKYPNWTVAKLEFVYIREGELAGTILFSRPNNKTKKTNRYIVSWREHSVCSSVVDAPNKKMARKIAEENFPDDRGYERSTDWTVVKMDSK